MQYVFGGILIIGGATLIGLAFHNKIGEAWSVLAGKA